MIRKTWTDPRDGTTWTITFDPGIEFSLPSEPAADRILVFESGDRRRYVEAVFGTNLEALTDEDLQELLDRSRTD